MSKTELSKTIWQLRKYLYDIKKDDYAVFDSEPYSCISRIQDLVDRMTNELEDRK